jgi:hypothetical protein
MLCGIGASAPAQAPAQPPALQPVLPAPKLNLTLEQRHVIRELIKDAKPQSSGNPHPAIGDTVAQNVDLKPMPEEVAQKVPQVKTHRYFVADGQIVIVDPKDNKVADLIKLESD